MGSKEWVVEYSGQGVSEFDVFSDITDAADAIRKCLWDIERADFEYGRDAAIGVRLWRDADGIDQRDYEPQEREDQPFEDR